MTAADLRHLLTSVLHSPHDDTARLVYADALEEGGEGERAEFIRVQIELAPLADVWCHSVGDGKAECDCRLCALRRRERELLGPNWVGWAGESLSTFFCTNLYPGPETPWPHLTFARGFVASVRLPLAAFVGGPCPTCRGTGDVRVPGGHGDTDTVLCPGCNPNEYERMVGIRHPNAGRTPGRAGDIFGAHPVTAVTLTGVEPTREAGGGWLLWEERPGGPVGASLPTELFRRLPSNDGGRWAEAGTADGTARVVARHWTDREVVNAALSHAAVSFGRSVAAGATHEGPCERCKGTGTVIRSALRLTKSVPCRDCSGTGTARRPGLPPL